MLSELELECPLPPEDATSVSAVKTWNISVSNDGKTFSNELQLTVYDSKCLDCQCGGLCQPKVSPILYFIYIKLTFTTVKSNVVIINVKQFIYKCYRLTHQKQQKLEL